MKSAVSTILAAVLSSTIGLSSVISAETGAPPDLTVELGETNHCNGLTVTSGGDGVNVPILVAGQAARRMNGEHAHYLYVRIDDPAYASGPRDL